MAEPVIERPPFMPPPSAGDVHSVVQWAANFTQLMSQIFQQYGYRLNLSIAKDGTVQMDKPLLLAKYEESELPDASEWEGGVVYVSDGSAGAKFRGSDGSSWVNLG